MNAIYSNERPARSDEFRPDYTDLVRDLGPDWLASGEKSRLASSIEFDYDFEQEFARSMDRHSILWQYKPRTFSVEWDEDGNFIDSFTPSFFLPARNVFIELLAPDCRLSSERARKARQLQQQHPAITIEVLSWAQPYQAVKRLC